jgi:hypothetical protein
LLNQNKQGKMMNLKKGKPRIIYNDDSCGLRAIPPPHSEEQISIAVDYMKDSQIGCVSWSMTSGDVAYSYYSDVIENFYDLIENDPDFVPAGKALEKNLIISLHKKGIDYLPMLIDKLHDIDITFCASFRMNDSHHKSRPQGGLSSKFWQEHQHCRLWEIQDGISYHNATLDFSYPEVRKTRVDAITEVATRYDIDAVELDFCRNRYLLQPSEAWEKRHIITDFVKLIRNNVNEIAKKKNKEINLVIRLPFADEKLKSTGIDLNAWLEQGLPDVLVMSNHSNDYDAKLNPWRELCRKKNILFYPSIEYAPKINPSPSVAMLPGSIAPLCNFWDLENFQLTVKRLRGMAQNYNAQDPDGIYIFNYACKILEDKRSPEEFNEMTSILHEIGSLETLKNKSKQYVFWVDLPIYVEPLRPPEYYQTIKFNIMDSSLKKSDKVILSFRRSVEKSPHSYEEPDRHLPDNYVNTILNGKTLDEKIFKKTKEKPGIISSGFTLGEHDKIEILLTGDDILYGENSLAFYMPDFPENNSPYVYIYELCVDSYPSQK